MSKAEIILRLDDPIVPAFEHSCVEYDGAAEDEYSRFMKIIEKSADWLLGASIRKDIDGNLLAIALLKMGPSPRWDAEYIDNHPDSEYLKRNGIRSYNTTQES